MVTNNARDVKLKIGVETDGGENVQKLANDLGDVAAAGKSAAPGVEKLAAELSALESKTKELRTTEAAARAEVIAQKNARAEQSETLARLRLETDKAIRGTDTYKQKERELRLAIIDSRAALREKQNALDQAGTAARVAAAAEKALIDQLQAAGTAYRQLGTAATAGAVQQRAANEYAAASLGDVGKKLDTLKAQVGAFVGVNLGAGMIKDALATADEFNNLQARIKLATGAGEAFTTSFKSISEIALRTGSNLEQTGVLFGKLTDAGKSAGLSTQAAINQALTLTETINQAVQLSGGSAEASKAAITQLIQGLQSGVLRGDEFNSVMEQAPRLSKALADSLGVTTGELRKMSEAGALSSDTVIKALKGQSATLRAEFATLPATVGRSVEKLQTQWKLYIGDLDKSKGITSKVAQGLDLLAGNLSAVIQTVQAASVGYAGYVAVQKLAGDSAQVAAVKIAAQGVASSESAIATRAHGAAASVASIEVARYGAAANVAGAQAAASGVAAVGGFRAVAAGAAAFVGKLGLIGTAAYAAYEVTKLAFSAGDALLKKWSGLDAAEQKLAESDRAYAQTLKDSAAAQEAQTLAKQAAIDKSFGLTTASSTLIGKFDELVKKGDSVAESISKIGKDFDLSTVPGIQQAGSILDKLLSDGKITATQFRAVWADALKGLDLAEFEVKARAAFAGSARGAAELQQALDAGVREAIARTGLDFAVISGGMGKAARSAINDTDAIIGGLDRLKLQGVNTAQALTASLGKGINTADSSKAIEAVKLQIKAVRAALGDKVADGLLDQAKIKATELVAALEKAKPGIQSVAEALKTLGITSDTEFKNMAEKSKLAFDAMRESGTASARELKEAFKKVATDAIAANNGIAPEWVKTEAAVRGVTIAVDENGKATVENAAKSKKAIEEVTRAYIPWGEAAEKAAEKATLAREKTIAAIEKENDLIQRATALENKRLGVDSDKFAVDSNGNRITQSIETKESVFKNAKSQGLTDQQAQALSDRFIGNRGEATGFGNVDVSRGENWFTAVQKEIDRMIRENRTAGQNNNPVTTHTVNVNIGGKSQLINVNSSQDAETVKSVIRQLGSAARSAGFYR